MQVSCPDCGTAFDAEEGADALTCPACFHAFRLDTPDRWMHVEVRAGGGRDLGVLDRYAIRERIYLGELKGQEEVRPSTGGDWVDIASRPEFAEVLALVGVDLGAGRIAKQSLKGWRKTGSAVSARPRKAAPQAVAGVTKTAATGKAVVVDEVEEAQERSRMVVYAVVGGVVALGLGWWLFG